MCILAAYARTMVNVVGYGGLETGPETGPEAAPAGTPAASTTANASGQPPPSDPTASLPQLPGPPTVVPAAGRFVSDAAELAPRPRQRSARLCGDRQEQPGPIVASGRWVRRVVIVATATTAAISSAPAPARKAVV